MLLSFCDRSSSPPLLRAIELLFVNYNGINKMNKYIFIEHHTAMQSQKLNDLNYDIRQQEIVFISK
jgi:hypothetical protein